MQWAPRIYKERTPCRNALRELGDSEGAADGHKHPSAGKQGAQTLTHFTCGSNGCEWALEHTVTEGSGVNSRETWIEASGPLGAWAILLTGLGRVFILRTGTFFFFFKSQSHEIMGTREKKN